MSTTAIVAKKSLIVAGLETNIFSCAPLDEGGRRRHLAVLFLLHGRCDSAKDVETLAESVLRYTHTKGSTNRDLVVVTFDHRNHGKRLVNSNANNDWRAGNAQHAIDMYAIQTGTASDVSFLIDFLPAYLSPSGELEVQEWMVSGVSLGGHSTWIVLKNEPRVKIGIPIIGCPDYLALMGPRAHASGLALVPPHMPSSLMEYVKAHDPASVDFSSQDPLKNPFVGKHVLVLCGANDRLVPWFASQKFVEALEVGNGTKKVVLDENAGHECSALMARELASFVWEYGIASPVKSN